MFNYLPRKQYDVALVNFEVASEIAPDSWGITYEMARIYAVRGEKKKALESLRQAVDKGLTDPMVIENQKDFETLLTEGECKAIVTALRKKQPRN